MILSPAKLNLSLKINNVLKNGYHSISSYVLFLDLFDKLFIKNSTQHRVEVRGRFKNDLINNGGDTIISKSLSFCQQYSHYNNKLNIILEKNIPVSAGLGGGSANSASILRYCLFKKDQRENKISNEVIKLSSLLGSDVPACLYSKPLLMEGMGEKITFVHFNHNLNIGVVLINPKTQLSTEKVFKSFVLRKPPVKKKSILKINTICDILDVCKLGNDLEKPAIKIVPEILNIFNMFKLNDECLSYGMSGSGATCYGIFHSRKKANDFKKNIIKKIKYKNYWIWSGGFLNKKKFDFTSIIK